MSDQNNTGIPPAPQAVPASIPVGGAKTADELIMNGFSRVAAQTAKGAAALAVPVTPGDIGPSTVDSAPPNDNLPAEMEPRAPNAVPFDPSAPPAPPAPPAESVPPAESAESAEPAAPDGPGTKIKPADLVNRFKDGGVVASPTAELPDIPDYSGDPIPDNLPDGADGADKAHHVFAKLRTRLKEYDKTILPRAREAMTNLQAQNAELDKAAKEARQAAEQRDQEVKDLQDKVGRLSLAESPQFQEKYDLRLREQEQKVADVVTRHTQLEGEEAMKEARKLLHMSPAELVEATDDYNPIVVTSASLVGAEIAKLQEARDLELKNWRESSLADRMETARQSVAELTVQRSQYADAALDSPVIRENPVFSVSDPQSREFVDDLKTAFRGFAKSATEEELVTAAADGFTVPFLREALAERDDTVRKLTEQLNQRRSAALPPVRPIGPAPAPKPAEPEGPAPAVVARGGRDARSSAEAMSRGVAAQLIQNLGGPPVNR